MAAAPATDAPGRAMDMGNMNTPNAADLDAAARRYCAAQGWAMPDGSYPVRPANMHGASDLAAAIRAVGRGGGSHDAIRRHIIKRAKAIGMPDKIPGNWTASGQSNSAQHAPDVDVVRSGGGIELRAIDGSLGLLTGRFTEFGRWYHVRSMLEGDFMERVQRGATADTIAADREAMRVLFDHGTDRQIGNKVLGPIEVLEEKSDGPRYEVPLFDTSYNRDLLPGLKAGVYGASMRMRVTGDRWDDEPQASEQNPDGLPERTITRMRVLEFGPVTFPANPGATAGMRSATDEFYGRLAEVNAPACADALRACGLTFEDFTGAVTARSGPAGGHDAQPGHGRTSQPSKQAALRDRAWRMRRQLDV